MEGLATVKFLWANVEVQVCTSPKSPRTAEWSDPECWRLVFGKCDGPVPQIDLNSRMTTLCRRYLPDSAISSILDQLQRILSSPMPILFVT